MPADTINDSVQVNVGNGLCRLAEPDNHPVSNRFRLIHGDVDTASRRIRMMQHAFLRLSRDPHASVVAGRTGTGWKNRKCMPIRVRNDGMLVRATDRPDLPGAPCRPRQAETLLVRNGMALSRSGYLVIKKAS